MKKFILISPYAGDYEVYDFDTLKDLQAYVNTYDIEEYTIALKYKDIQYNG